MKKAVLKFLGIFASLVMLVSPLISCTGTTVPSGALTVAYASFGGEVFDPIKCTGTNADTLLTPMFDPLFLLNGSDVAPGIVEKWEIAPDSLSWTYFIRKGVKFHNDEDLKADDVKFTLDRFCSKDSFYKDISGIVDHTEIVDDYTVRIYTKGPQPFLPYYSTVTPNRAGWVMPKDYFEKVGAESFNLNPVGSGPFKFVKHVSGDRVEYEANKNYWRQVPAFEKLTILQVPEESTRLALLKAGDIDACDISLESSVDLEAARIKTYSMTSLGVSVVLMGTYAPQGKGTPTADVNVRHALSLAINRDEIRKVFFYGKAGPPMTARMTEMVGEVDFRYWQGYAAKVYNYNPTEAKRLLEEAGLQDGFNIKIYASAQGGAPYVPKLCEVIQGYWKDIGINAEIVPMDWGTFTPMRTSGPDKTPQPPLIGQAAVIANSPGPIYPKNLTTFWYTKGTYNLLSGTKPELDKSLDATLSEMDMAKRKEMVTNITKTGTETYTVLCVCTVPDMVAVGPKITIDFPQTPVALSLNLLYAKPR